jgi:hypothetical protein
MSDSASIIRPLRIGTSSNYRGEREMELNRRETPGLLGASGAAMMLPEAARTVGWSGGFGTKWQSDPAKR